MPKNKELEKERGNKAQSDRGTRTPKAIDCEDMDYFSQALWEGGPPSPDWNLSQRQRELIQAAYDDDFEKISEITKSGISIPGVFPDALQESISMGMTQDIALLIRIYPDFKRYEVTGEVGNSLLPLFDQNGSWWGIGLGEGTFKGLERLKLDPKRLVQPDPLQAHDTRGQSESQILLSSYVSTGEEAQTLPYSEIFGDCNLFKAAAIYAPNLRKVGRGFFANQASNISLPKLEHIGGSLGLGTQKEVNLPNLKRVWGDTSLWKAESVELPSLEYVGEDLACPSANLMQVPKLKKVGASIVCGSLQSAEFESLEVVEKFIETFSAKTFYGPKLRHVGGHLDARAIGERNYIREDTQISYKAFHTPTLKYVGGLLVLERLKYLSLPQIKILKDSTKDYESKTLLSKEYEQRLNTLKVLKSKKDLELPTTVL